MNYAAIKTYDIANGPGVRTSVFVSGCTRHCKNCFNQEAWDFNYGEPFDYGEPLTQEVLDGILKTLEPPHIAGLTVLGGEPFEPKNQAGVAELLRQVRARFPEKSLWAFTGYLLDSELLAGKVGDAALVREILSRLNVLVDGPFEIEKKDLALRFRGSSNQRIIDMNKTRETGEVTLWNAKP